MKLGYARVSTDEQSLQAQAGQRKAAGDPGATNASGGTLLIVAAVGLVRLADIENAKKERPQ